MTEDEARDWIAARWGSAAVDRLQRYADLLIAAAPSQNLVAPSTLAVLWDRHIVDSAQLVPLADGHKGEGEWIDIGSGAGLPGIVAAILQHRPVVMVEPRRQRARFLEEVISSLKLDAIVEQRRIETLTKYRASVISSRAVASLDTVLFLAQRVATPETLWLLPKGRSADAELELATKTWQGTFHVEQSVTASDSSIVVAKGVMSR